MKLLTVAAAPIGDAIAEEKPAANRPTLMNTGARPPINGSSGAASSTTLVTSVPCIKAPAVIRMAAVIRPPTEIKIGRASCRERVHKWVAAALESKKQDAEARADRAEQIEAELCAHAE